MSFFSGFNRRRLSSLRGFAVCAALAMGSVLAAPLGAQALDFNWYFTASTGEVTRGTIKGLVEGYNPGGAGEIVEVVDTPLTLALGGDWVFDSSISSPSLFAFNVVGGEIVAADAFYQRMTGALGTLPFVGFGKNGPGISSGYWNAQLYDGSGGALYGDQTIFGLPPAPAPAPVPAPLSIFGAAVAFGYGRRLRSRVRAARGCYVLAPSL
jgi:hypothetical protein